MEINENDKQLKDIVNKWETAFYVSQALLEDYAERMAKLTSENKETIKKRVMNRASAIQSESKTKQ
jgi:hypothetical protein